MIRMLLHLEWSVLRRAHQLILLATLAVIWGLAATSFFMTRASSIRIPAAPARVSDATRSSSILLAKQAAHPLTATVKERIRILPAPAHAGDATRSSSPLFIAPPAHPSIVAVEERTLFAAERTLSAAPSAGALPDTAQALAPQQLEVLHKLLGLKATSLSQAQRASYAAALRNALRQLSSGAPPEDAPRSGDRAQQGLKEHLGATPAQGYTPSEPAAAPESIGVEHSATDSQEGEQEGEN